MALPDTIGLKAGTAITWTSSGGTYALDLTSLPGISVTGRSGAKGDLGANWAQLYHVLFQAKPLSAPTDGLALALYWCASTSATAGTGNPGNLSGTDATLSSTGSLASQTARQLKWIGDLSISNTQGAVVQTQGFEFTPPTRYGFPVVVNLLGVALSATGTDHKVTLTPAILEVAD